MNINVRNQVAAVICLLAFTHPVFAEEYASFYFFGYLKHVKDDPRNHEGNMRLFGVSKEMHYGDFQFDTGVNTYRDSYRRQSYTIFSNISHEDYRLKYLTPMLGVALTNKGKDYDSSERQTYLLAVPKLRIGAREGLFIDISGLPKIGDITNGWVALETGYKW
jgi:hypothetical protein